MKACLLSLRYVVLSIQDKNYEEIMKHDLTSCGNVGFENDNPEPCIVQGFSGILTFSKTLDKKFISQYLKDILI